MNESEPLFDDDPPESRLRPQRAVRPRTTGVSGWILVLLLGIIVFLLYRYRAGLWADLHDPEATARAVTPRGELAPVELTQVQIFEQASPSVVHITSITGGQQRGTGTGFVWSRDGYVVTNYHVIAAGSYWQVTMSDATSYAASYVGGEPSADIAVLKIGAEPGRLVPIPVGVSSDLKVGQNVYAIGSPFGLDQTLTAGIVSGLGRQIAALDGSPIEDVIQTDAAINPGNSGGPLLDSAGRAIGVNTAIFSPSGTNAGVGFSIPIDTVNRLVPELIRGGRTNKSRPSLGITIRRDDALERLRNSGITGLPEQGVLIQDVLAGSAAERAGLRGERHSRSTGSRLGDVIIGLDDQPIDSADDLFRELAKRKVGDQVKLTVIRDGEPLQVTATLQDRPGWPQQEN